LKAIPPRLFPACSSLPGGRCLAGFAAALFIAGCNSSPPLPPREPPPSIVDSPPTQQGAVSLPPVSAVNVPRPSRLPPGANADFPTAPRPSGPRPAPAPAPLSGSGQRIGNVEYVDAAAFFARYGLRPAGPVDNLRAIFQGSGSHLEMTANDREMTLNNLRVFLGEPTQVRSRAFLISRTDAERLLGPILAPAGIPAPMPRVPRVIVLDPGHGGQDSGAPNLTLGVFEKNFTLDVALRLKPLLEARGWQVVMTRSADHYIPLAERPAMAIAARADLFISIHFNSVAPDTKTTGTEIYTFPPQFERSTRSWGLGEKDDSETTPDPSNRLDAWNAVLANTLHRALLARLGTFDRGQKMAHYAVLKGLNCPAVLIESAFLSNDSEARKVSTPAFRQQIAEGIASGLTDYAAQVAALKK